MVFNRAWRVCTSFFKRLTTNRPSESYFSCFSDWTLNCLLLGPNLLLMRTEGWMLTAGQWAQPLPYSSSDDPSTCRIGASREEDTCWPHHCTSCSTSKHHQASSVPLGAALCSDAQQAIPWGVLKSSKGHSSKQPPLTCFYLYWMPQPTFSPPQTHLSHSNPTMQDRDMMAITMACWISVPRIQSQKRRNTACSWKRGVSSENRRGNLSKPGSLSKGKHNQRDVCLQPTKPLYSQY